MGKHRSGDAAEGFPVGNKQSGSRGRGGDDVIGQQVPKHVTDAIKEGKVYK